MCFSATASFAMSGVLAIIGIAAYRLVHHKSQRMLSLIPIFFALQQAAEGIVWLTIGRPSLQVLQYPAAYVFLFFAFITWPLWIPLSLHVFYHRIKNIRSSLLVIWGCMVSTFFGYYLFTTPFALLIEHRHIVYNFDYTQHYGVLSSIAYLMATFLPFLIAPRRVAQFFGILVILSYAIAYLLYHYAVVSVWCFFAAGLSVLLCLMIWQDNREKSRA
ncbi:hypothetical protein HYX58_06165 [Candidatus Dependentiae bacterium]|nr:hypothetical protein [Candidatus Dependentiae bacterium]